MLNDEEAKLGRALAGGHIPSVAKAVVQNSVLREEVFLQLLNLVDEECRTLCQKNDPSRFRRIPVAELGSFQWEQFIDELRSKAPTLLCILYAISSRKHNSESIQQHHRGICMAAAAMLKERNREMCGIPSLISLLLYATHAEKQVCMSVLTGSTNYSCTCKLPLQSFYGLHFTWLCINFFTLYYIVVLHSGVHYGFPVLGICSFESCEYLCQLFLDSSAGPGHQSTSQSSTRAMDCRWYHLQVHRWQCGQESWSAWWAVGSPWQDGAHV